MYSLYFVTEENFCLLTVYVIRATAYRTPIYQIKASEMPSQMQQK